jgi:hypothetical protein
MTFSVDDKIGEQLKCLAAKYDREPDAYLAELLDQAFNHGGTLPGAYVRPLKTPDWVHEIKPAFTPPPGKHWSDYVIGKWPGDETDAEILEALEKNS